MYTTQQDNYYYIRPFFLYINIVFHFLAMFFGGSAFLHDWFLHFLESFFFVFHFLATSEYIYIYMYEALKGAT